METENNEMYEQFSSYFLLKRPLYIHYNYQFTFAEDKELLKKYKTPKKGLSFQKGLSYLYLYDKNGFIQLIDFINQSNVAKIDNQYVVYNSKHLTHDLVFIVDEQKKLLFVVLNKDKVFSSKYRKELLDFVEVET